MDARELADKALANFIFHLTKVCNSKKNNCNPKKMYWVYCLKHWTFETIVLGLLLLWRKTMTRSKLWRKQFIVLTLPCHRLLSWEVRAGTQAGRTSCRRHGEILLPGLLLLACSAFFLIKPRTTSTRVVPPTMGWENPYQSLIRKISYMVSYHPILWKHFFFTEVPSSQMAWAHGRLI